MDSKRPNLTGLLAHRWEPIRIKSCQLAVSSVLLGLHFIVLLQKALQIPNILHSWQLWWEVCQVLASFLQVGHQKVVTDRKKPGRISVCEHYTGCCTDFHLNGIAAMFFFHCSFWVDSLKLCYKWKRTSLLLLFIPPCFRPPLFCPFFPTNFNYFPATFPRVQRSD